MDILDKLEQNGKIIHFFPPEVRVLPKKVIFLNQYEYIFVSSDFIEVTLELICERMGKIQVLPYNEAYKEILDLGTKNYLEIFDLNNEDSSYGEDSSLEDGYFYSESGVFYGRCDKESVSTKKETNNGICEGITKKGLRCKNKVYIGNYCYHHK